MDWDEIFGEIVWWVFAVMFVIGMGVEIHDMFSGEYRPSPPEYEYWHQNY